MDSVRELIDRVHRCPRESRTRSNDEDGSWWEGGNCTLRLEVHAVTVRSVPGNEYVSSVLKRVKRGGGTSAGENRSEIAARREKICLRPYVVTFKNKREWNKSMICEDTTYGTQAESYEF